MKVIVAGSRSIKQQRIVDLAINEAFNYWMAHDQENWQQYIAPEIVSGGAYGVDWLGEKYAKKYNLKVKVFPADWETYGKAAGHIRNKQMGDYADRLIAVWDGKSPGTKGMIKYMKSLNKEVYVVSVNNE